jgi:hypothetical protein
MMVSPNFDDERDSQWPVNFYAFCGLLQGSREVRGTAGASSCLTPSQLALPMRRLASDRVHGCTLDQIDFCKALRSWRDSLRVLPTAIFYAGDSGAL